MNVSNLSITQGNYFDIAKKLSLSYSILRKLIGARNTQILEHEPCFYDIETDENNKFLCGVVNDTTFYKPEDLILELRKYRICCGFNNFRFDNELLARLVPNGFKTQTHGSFILHKVWNATNIDMLPCFMLWKPFMQSHTLNNLATELGINREYNLDQKKQKCREDVMILRQFYPYAKKLLNQIEISFLLDPETVCSQYYNSYNKLRRWMLQSWMLQNNIVPTLMQKSDPRKPSFYFYHKKGFFFDINVHDVKSAYPTTAINLGCSLYRKNDFAEYLKFLIQQRKDNPDIEQFYKWSANATIGDMNYTDGLLYDKKIICDVWLTFKKKMQQWIRKIGKENVKYSFTDCVYTQLDHVPEMKGYEIGIKHKFKWVAVFNQQRILGLTDENKIHKIHFNKPIKLKMFFKVDQLMEEKLRDDPLKFLKDPKLDLNLKDQSEDDFAIVVHKTGNTCRSIEYLDIWQDLQMGLNNVYLNKDGVTTDPNKIAYNKYQKYINSYMKLFKLRVKS